MLTRIEFLFLAAFITACGPAAAPPSDDVLATADFEPTSSVSSPRPTRTAVPKHVPTTENPAGTEAITFLMPGFSVEFYAQVALPASLY